MMQSSTACSFVGLVLVLFQSLMTGIVSFAPPHPGTTVTENDPVLQYRRRMELDHAECDIDNPESCDFMDLTFKKEAKANQVLMQQSNGDVFRVLVIPMYFTNHRDRPRLNIADIEDMWTGVGTNDENIPGGSIANWTSLNSYGKVTLEAEVVDWMETVNSESYFASGRSGVPTNSDWQVQMEDAVVPLLDQLDNSNFDFSRFDQDKDMYVDATVILHSGYAAEIADVDCDGVQKLDRIQSYARSFNPGVWTSSSGYHLGPIVFSSAYRGSCNANIARIGTITHELLHTFGLPDLYDTSGKYVGGSGSVGGLGGYDIMANPNGPRSRQAYPGSLSPWSKMQLGWLEPIEITTDGVYTMQASNLEPSVYMISSPYPWGEYLLIENRQPVLFDERLWTPGGVLIYKVDEPMGSNAYRGYPGQAGWPGNGEHYRVALLQRDGLYQLEKSESNGHIDDFWTAGSELGPGNGEQVWSTSGTYPNTDSYSEGNIQTTGLIIRNFEETSPGVWSFEVSGLQPQQVPDTPAPVTPATPAPVTPATPAPVTPATPAPVTPATPAPVTPATPSPTKAPVAAPTDVPTAAPTNPQPTPSPTVTPTSAPTSSPTNTAAPTTTPSPTNSPTTTPQPTDTASNSPTLRPTPVASMTPTDNPTKSLSPSPVPTATPTAEPTATDDLSEALTAASAAWSTYSQLSTGWIALLITSTSLSMLCVLQW